MLIIIFGESCTGKSTLADALKARTGAQVWSGKDYLRLAKSEGEARRPVPEAAERSSGGRRRPHLCDRRAGAARPGPRGRGAGAGHGGAA